MIRLLALVACLITASLAQSPGEKENAAIPPMNGTQYPTVGDFPAPYLQLITGMRDENRAELIQRLPYESISIERTPCYGTCPVYKATFFRDGHADFHAKAHLPKLGDFKGEIYYLDFARLCLLIQDSGFSKMKPKYRSGWTDASTCIVTITQQGHEISVSDYGSVGPNSLWAIQQALDSVRAKVDWQ